MSLKHFNALSALLVFTIVVFTACSSEEAAEDRSIDIAVADTPQSKLLSALATSVLEDSGYTVNHTMVSRKEAWRRVAEDSSNVFLSAAMPDFDDRLYDQFGEWVEISGVNVLDVKPGLAVPAYANMDSVPQLRGAQKMVEGRVISLAGDMASEALLKKALGAYGLSGLKVDTTHKLAFDEYMDDKTSNQEWVVVYTRQPNYSVSRHDLRFLEDPKKAFGEVQQLVTIAHKGFRYSDELASSFLSSMIVQNDDFSAMLDQMQLGMDPEKIAADWKTKNAISIASWMPESDDKSLEHMFGGGE